MRKTFAFTLIETVITLGIISILFFALIPVFSNFLGVLDLKGQARLIVADLRAAQDKAITLKSTISAEFKPKTLFGEPATYVIDRVNVSSGRKQVFKSTKLSNKFDFTDLAVIKFAKSGSPPPGGSGTVKLEYIGGRRISIIVSSAGRVRME
jgi:type II secretory pathway pseudopilin PulG